MKDNGNTINDPQSNEDNICLLGPLSFSHRKYKVCRIRDLYCIERRTSQHLGRRLLRTDNHILRTLSPPSIPFLLLRVFSGTNWQILDRSILQSM